MSMNIDSLRQIVADLSHDKPIFINESDFQRSLAEKLEFAGYATNLEHRTKISINGVAIAIRVDIIAK